MFKLIGIKVKNKIFYSVDKNSEYKYLSSNFLINGKEIRNTYFKDWHMIDNEIKSIQQKQSQSNINYRYEIKDEKLISDEFPKIVKAIYDNEDNDYYIDDIYVNYKYMYELRSDKQEDKIIDIEFEYKQIMEIESEFNLISFEYSAIDREYGSDKFYWIKTKDIEHQIIDKIIFPEIVLHERPCKLSKINSYRIIRNYIKQNIDNKIAKITSDYDFCLTVKKIITLCEPEEYLYDINQSWKYKKGKKSIPKYEKRYRRKRELTIFKISPEGYQDYPVIKEFVGKNHEDLKKNIDNYLKELIEFINEPIIECSHCKGYGVFFNKEFKNE